MTIISVGRDGKEIGDYNLEGVREGLASGYFLPDDLGWYEGLTEWLPLPEVAAKLSDPPPPASPLPEEPKKRKAAKAPKEAKPKNEPTPRHDWHLDPATEKQIDYLSSFGVTAASGMTKGEASDLIDKCTNDPNALERRDQIRLVRYEQEQKERAKFPSYYLKADIADAAKQMEDVKKDPDHSKDDVKDAGDYHKYQQALRLNYWKSTFKEDWISADEDGLLIDFVDTIDKFYSEYGKYFKVPTNKQVTEILDALDKALPDWNKNDPVAFYATLQKSFPDCTRKNVGGSKSAKGQGCLVLLIGIIIIPYLITHIKW